MYLEWHVNFCRTPQCHIFWRCIQHFSSCYMCTAGQSNCNRCCAAVWACLKIRISGKGCTGLESSKDQKLRGRWRRSWKGTVREQALKESKAQSEVKWKLAKNRIQWKALWMSCAFPRSNRKWLWWCWNKIYMFDAMCIYYLTMLCTLSVWYCMCIVFEDIW